MNSSGVEILVVEWGVILYFNIEFERHSWIESPDVIFIPSLSNFTACSASPLVEG